MGFQYKLREPADGMWGNNNNQGKKWNGMIGEIVDGMVSKLNVVVETGVRQVIMLDRHKTFEFQKKNKHRSSNHTKNLQESIRCMAAGKLLQL